MRGPTPAPPVYSGACRNGIAAGRAVRALRLRVPPAPHGVVGFTDRWHGALRQDLADAVGDFIVRRADGYWAYQLAVVVDDAAQGVTHVVRGADLLDSTPRQIYLQGLLGLPRPAYLHVPVVTNPAGDKLSKQTGAQAFDTGAAPAELLRTALLPAARFLGMELRAASLDDFWRLALPAWAQLLRRRGAPAAP
ncbi:glutamyl/glutaminyl-tRNA synthetase [Janthinobacterium sp. CG_23.3]